jgi:hypothetical protein
MNMTEKQERGFTLSESFAGADKVLDHMKKKKQESQAKFDRALAKQADEQWKLGHWRIEPKTIEQKMFVAEELVRMGLTLTDFEKVVAKVEAKNRQAQLEHEEQEERNRLQMAERARFPNLYMRLCTYLGIPKFRAEIEEAAKKASLEDLKETQERLLKGEKPELGDTQRSTALVWLSAEINERTSKPKPESLAQKFGKFAHLP